jgi:hypothetical protein
VLGRLASRYGSEGLPRQSPVGEWRRGAQSAGRGGGEYRSVNYLAPVLLRRPADPGVGSGGVVGVLCRLAGWGSGDEVVGSVGQLLDGGVCVGWEAVEWEPGEVVGFVADGVVGAGGGGDEELDVEVVGARAAAGEDLVAGEQ